MSVQRDHAERIAALARLRFGVEELTRMTEEMNHILEHVEALRSLGSPEGATADHPTGTPLEPDLASTRAGAAEEPDPLLGGIESVAPSWQDGFFVVPPLPGVHGEEGA